MISNLKPINLEYKRTNTYAHTHYETYANTQQTKNLELVKNTFGERIKEIVIVGGVEVVVVVATSKIS